MKEVRLQLYSIEHFLFSLCGSAARVLSIISQCRRGCCRYQDDTSAFLCKSNTLWMINICWFLHSISIAWQCMQIEFLSLSVNVTGPNLKYLSSGARNWTEKVSAMLFYYRIGCSSDHNMYHNILAWVLITNKFFAQWFVVNIVFIPAQ